MSTGNSSLLCYKSKVSFWWKFIIYSFSYILISVLFFSNLSQARQLEPITLTVEESGYNPSEGVYLIQINFDVTDGWKMFSSEKQDFGIPLAISLADESQGSLIDNFSAFYQKGIESLELDEYPSFIYKGNPAAFVSFKSSQNLTENIKLKVDFSACKDLCVPISKVIDLKNPQFNQEKYNSIASNISKTISDNGEVASKYSFIFLIIFGFIGGFILNLMPCVLPILSIKLLDVVNARSDPNTSLASVRVSFLSSVAGIIFAFLVLASFIIISKILYNQTTIWGVQLQNYFIVGGLIWLISGIIFATLNDYSIGVPSFILNMLAKAPDPKGIVAHFSTGILNVILATPCSAPFLASSLAFTINASGWEILILMLSIAIGMSLPYTMVAIFPASINLLPKPGKWVLTVKKISSLMLLLTIFWLFYVLAQQTSWLVSCLLLLYLIVAFACFSWQIKRGIARKNLRLIILAFFLVISFATLKWQNYLPKFLSPQNSVLVKEFNKDMLEAKVEAGKKILVVVTADWCITCKYNYQALRDADFNKYLKEQDIEVVIADFTKPSKEIQEFLLKYDTNSIPFTIYYNSPSEFIILPVIYSKNTLLEKIKAFEQNEVIKEQ